MALEDYAVSVSFRMWKRRFPPRTPVSWDMSENVLVDGKRLENLKALDICNWLKQVLYNDFIRDFRNSISISRAFA